MKYYNRKQSKYSPREPNVTNKLKNEFWAIALYFFSTYIDTPQQGSCTGCRLHCCTRHQLLIQENHYYIKSAQNTLLMLRLLYYSDLSAQTRTEAAAFVRTNRHLIIIHDDNIKRIIRQHLTFLLQNCKIIPSPIEMGRSCQFIFYVNYKTTIRATAFICISLCCVKHYLLSYKMIWAIVYLYCYV